MPNIYVCQQYWVSCRTVRRIHARPENLPFYFRVMLRAHESEIRKEHICMWPVIIGNTC